MSQQAETQHVETKTTPEVRIGKGPWDELFTELLAEGIVDLLLVPQELPSKKTVVQTLVKSPTGLNGANPCAPILMENSARLVSNLTFQNMDKKIGVVLRPCEIRTVIELAKLKQVTMDSLYIIGVDCLGTFEYRDFAKLLESESDIRSLTEKFMEGELELGDIQLRAACRMCVYGVPEDVDRHFRLWEDDSSVMEHRKKERERILQETEEKISSISGLIDTLAGCRRCYNCRRACPICYCRECIFDTITFEHPPEQYLRWVERKETVKMPADTLLFHITRLNHMVTSCVSCGQCTSACPNDIPVGAIFSAVGGKVQEVFEYVPGRSIDDELPLSTFKEEELQPT